MINTSKIIKKVKILDNINLSVKHGELVSIIGPNGSGKSMLLRTIAGLTPYTNGDINVNGQVIGKEIEHPLDVGILIENPVFIDELTAFDNLKLLASIKNIVSYEQIEEVLNLIGLKNNKNTKLKKFSLGMKQRLGLAQALMESPKLLILDEPTNTLDEEGIELIKTILIEEKNKGTTIIITSHDKEFVNQISDKTLYISEGKIK
jgi:ABC-2 type transport system ATP-binding protein